LPGKRAEKRFLWLRWSRYEREPLCRDHLFAAWRERFLASPSNKVVLDPIGNLGEFRDLSVQFWYAEPGKLAAPNPGVSKADRERREGRFRSWIEQIAGNCEKCGQIGSVGWADGAQVKFANVGQTGAEWVNMDLDHFSPRLRILCASCAFGAIEKSIRSSRITFRQGIDGPGDFPGIYLTVTQ